MAWLEGWGKRAAITFDCSGESGSGTQDAEIVLDPTWDEFWDAIDAAGDEIRITAADGVTGQTYQWKSGTFNKTNKTGTIELDNVAFSYGPSVVLLWLYYDNSGAADGSGSFTAATPNQGYVDLLEPATVAPVETQRPGATTPPQSVALTTTSIMPITIDVRKLLRSRKTAHDSRLHGEELEEVVVAVRDTSDSVVAGGAPATKPRFTADARYRSGLVTMYVDAPGGSLADGSNYVACATCHTSTAQTIEARVGLTVYDLRPSA